MRKIYYRSFCAAFVIWLQFVYIAPVLSQDVGLSAGCPLSLPPELGGVCDYLNNLLLSGKLRPHFGVPGTTGAFGVDSNGQAQFIASVYIFDQNSNSFVSAKATYSFKVQDVEFPIGPDVKIECKQEKCINVSGTGISSLKIALTVLDIAGVPLQEIFQSLEKLKSFFCPNGSC